MKKTYALALHIFRRDLRLEDNTALIEALSTAEAVIPAFIFDNRQIENNPYKSNHCLQFMAHSLQELDDSLKQKHAKLYCFYGTAEQIVEQLIAQLNIQAIFINRDYTPFSKDRDERIEKICKIKGVAFYCYADTLLNEPEAVLKPDQKPYTIFTHAYKKAIQFPVGVPRKNNHTNYYQKEIPLENKTLLAQLLKQTNPQLFVKGGRAEALALLKKINQLQNYQDIRNFPAIEGTTKLSAHNKFGTLSCREFYAAVIKLFDKTHALITELYWRDFFTHIAFYFPRVFGHSFHEKYDKVPVQYHH